MKSLDNMTARYIYTAGKDWKQFDYEKGLDALIQKDKDGNQIYNAGVDWKQFNYEKGLNALIQKYKNEVLIYLAGRDWPQFNYEKGLDALKKISKHYYENALEYWPKDIKQTQKIIDKLKKRSKKFPEKPYKLRESEKDLEHYKDWKKADLISEFNKLLMRYKDHVYQGMFSAGIKEKIIDFPVKHPDLTYDEAIFLIKKFSLLKRIKNKLIDSFPKNIQQSLDAIKELKTKSIEFPSKRLSLKEVIDLKNIDDPEKILQYGREHGYSDELFDILKRIDDPTGVFMARATITWPQFNYERGYNEIIKQKLSFPLYIIGRYWDWMKFPYKEAIDYLKLWEKQVKSSKHYYELALKDWPKDIKQSQEIIDELKKRSQKFENKPYKLKEDTKNLSSMTPNDIYWTGKLRLQFNYEKGLDALIEKDKTGYYIYSAGINWKQFNYEKGFNALIKKDKTGNYIYLAGIYWKQFDYEKGLDALKKFPKYYEEALRDWPKGIKQSQEIIDELKKRSKKFPSKPYKLKEDTRNYSSMTPGDIYWTGKLRLQFDHKKGLDALIQKDKIGDWIYYAGRDWPQFNYEKGLDALIKKDKSGYWIYHSGVFWKQFNYEKGLNALEKFPERHRQALEDWPKGIKETQKAIDEIKKRSIKFSGKPYKLK